MLPKEIFEPLLSSITVTEPSDQEHYASYEAIPLSFATDERTSFPEPPVRIWYRTDTKISIAPFLEKLRTELRNSRHKDDQLIVGSLLVLFAIHPQRINGPTAVLNHLLSMVADGDLSQFFIFPYPPYPGFREFRIGQFLIGALDSFKLGYRSSRAGSDYFDRYGDRLKGSFTFERDITQVRVLDLDRLSSEFEGVRGSEAVARLWSRSVESYFQALASAYFEDFWELLLEEQHLLIALGSSYIDDRNMRAFPFATPVSIFMKINGSWGHVAPGRLSGFDIDFVSLDRSIPLTLKRLNDEYNVKSSGPLQPTLRSYAEFLSKAKRYLDQRLSDESFLHYVIALELLFGERTGTTESVSRRVGTLVFRPLDLSLVEAKRRLEKLYDARSRYVHAGVGVDQELLDEVKSVCDQVLHALLRRLRNVGEAGEMRDQWLKDIDYLFSALVAGKSVDDRELLSCGILPGHPRVKSGL